MQVLTPLLFFVLFNSFWVFITKKEFGKCISFSLLLVAFTLYFSQLCLHTYQVGFWCLIGIAVLGLVLNVIKRDEENINRLFSIGFWVFVSIFILYFIIDFHRSLDIFDELRHWGLTIKECLRLDRFYSVPESNCGHKDYPPLICMFEVFWCLLTGGYSEMKVSMAIHIFQISIIVPGLFEYIKDYITVNKKWQNIIMGFFGSLIILIIFLSVDPYPKRITTSILLDILMPVIFTHSMFLIYKNKRSIDLFDFCSLVATNTALLMLKQVGLGFLLVVEFYYLMTVIFHNSKSVKEYIKVVCAFIIPIMINFTWTSYVKDLGIVGQFSLSKISVKDYINALVGLERGLRHDTLKNYIIALFQKQINTVNFFPITYVSAYLLVLFLLVIIYRVNKQTIKKCDLINLLLTFTCGTFGYAFMMSVLYAFCFNPTEMAQLASYDRYMASYVLGEILIILFFSLPHFLNKYQIKISLEKCILCYFALAITLNPENMLYLAPQIIRGNNYEPYETDANYMASKTDYGSKIFIIYDKTQRGPNWSGAYFELLTYYVNDRVIDYKYAGSYDYDFSNEEVKENVLNEIGLNDYLYVRHVNESVQTLLSEIYEGPVTENCIFKIEKSGNDYSLTLVE